MRYFSRKFVLLIASAVIGAVVLGACSAQESNTYPVDIFIGMHYSPAIRAYEPDIPQHSGAQPLVSCADPAYLQIECGNTAQNWEVPEVNRRDYVPANARELYSVNCSTCHGDNGTGDGALAQYLAGDRTLTGERYEGGIPNLNDTRERFTTNLGEPMAREQIFTIINNGVNVMPRFRELLSEEDIREIVDYVFDLQNGLDS